MLTKSQSIQHRTARVGSALIHYQVAGAGQPLVLIHGLSGSSRWWSRNIEALARHFRLYVVDLVGFGASRNGHPFVLAEAAGYLALVIFGLQDAGPALTTGVSSSRVGAAAISLGLTAGVMVWCRVPHPPAGATTLIVSLGILHEPWQLAVLMLAVLLLVLQGLGINRLAGVPYPLWRPAPPDASAIAGTA